MLKKRGCRRQCFFLILLGLLIAGAFLSCANEAPLYTTFAETDTIRYSATEENRSISWTPYLNTDYSLGDEPKVKDMGKVFRFNTDTGISYAPPQTSVYPSITGFGSLDTSQISADIRENLDAFLAEAGKGTIAERYFDQAHTFIRVVAQYELARYPKFSNYLIGKPYIARNDEKPLYEVPVLIREKESGFIIRLTLNAREAERGVFLIEHINFEVFSGE